MSRIFPARWLAALTATSYVTAFAVGTRAEGAPPAPVTAEPAARRAPRAPEREHAPNRAAPARFGRDSATLRRSQRAVVKVAPGTDDDAGPAASPVPSAVPGGADKTGVSSQVLSVPQGAGKVQGMGESFSAQLSTGAATYSVPFALPRARGDVSPTLALAYTSSGGHGLAGVGWDTGVPFIARQTDRGIPLYRDPAPGGAWQPTQDRFVFSGGQELVPIGLVSGGVCPGALVGEVMPVWANGWQYFRPRVEGSFLRFFWSRDHRTWRVQDKSGASMELGAPLDGGPSTGALESDPGNASHVYRWNLSRQYDAYGDVNPSDGSAPRPVNVVQYRYMVDAETAYLTDIYDTPPAANAANADVSTYAHHVRLRYEARPDATLSYRRGWAAEQALRLAGVDVTSKPFRGGTAASRRLVRRYHLAYDPAYHVSLLASVQLEGRCGSPSDGEEGEPVVEDSNGALNLSACPRPPAMTRLPAMTFGYSHVAPRTADGGTGLADLPGFEGFDERVIAMEASPSSSLDALTTELLDVDGDALPDVLVTTPGAFGAAHGVFFNGHAQADTFEASTVGIAGVLGEDVGTVTLRNGNVSAGDLDGDGIVDLVHMPRKQTYSVYSPALRNGKWIWMGRSIATASQQSPKIDFTAGAANVQRMDVNADGLVDVVVSTGTEIETFFALGRYPGGDGQFGHAQWTGPASADLSNDPVAACVPTDGLPLRFSDTDVKIADMNGDGLPDIVRARPGELHYWPGRGDGTWGTGAREACRAGAFVQGTSIAMAASPQYSDPNGSAVHIDDVNGDGLDDLVQVRFGGVDVWLNENGTSWTARHVIANSPAAPGFQNHVRLADINGSGTRDIVWGDGGAYRYMDLSGGARPWVLTHVENGLGKTTDLEYASSTTLMRADRASGKPWESVAPIAIHVVVQQTVSDNLPLSGRAAGLYVTQYTYRDPVYDGRQREFRGFRTARETQIGGPDAPTSSRETTFALGECVEEAGGAGAACTPAARWRDNPREALKGLSLSTHVLDAAGIYQTSVHHTYRLRRLYVGADGREVRHAFDSVVDTYLYDTASPDGGVDTVTLPEVELELSPPPFAFSESYSPVAVVPAERSGALSLHGTAGRAHTRKSIDVDVNGNPYRAIDFGCVDGCPDADDVLTTYSDPREVSGKTGWLWRTYQSTTWGLKDGFGRHTHQQLFDAAGSPIQTQQNLQGTLPLVRANPGGATAPAPAQASKDGVIISLKSTFDVFGSPLAQVTPNQRCRSTTFDDDYAALAVTDTTYVGAPSADGCGGTPLVAAAEYDRGLGVVTRVRDIHGESSTTRYDGFGRIVALTQSDPTTGEPAALPSVTFEYFLPADPRGTPYARLRTRTQDGAAASDDSYRDAWTYIDGLGRTAITLDQADPSAGDAAGWIASGLVARDAKGEVQRAYLPFFYDGDPAGYPLASIAAAPSSRVSRDAFGREVTTYTIDGALSGSTQYHALSVDAWDAADLDTGVHAGTYASRRQDGHGRTVSMIERARDHRVLELHETRITYLSTGEPSVITRLRGDGTTPAVVRWMGYDSLGRMVVNVTPDTSVGFKATPSANPSSIKAWRYAYNDDGDLVGTSDARGCGQNFAYDAAGRLVGEDYSPCAATQPAYTPASASGGFEVAYHYDTLESDADAAIDGFPVRAPLLAGRLTSVTDRSGRAITRYDGRGRVTGVARRLVTPSGSLAPRWYVATTTFDAADRVRVETTGAVDAGGAFEVTAATTTTYSKRGAVRRVDSDHGPLVDHVTHEADGRAVEIGYADAAHTTTAFTYDLRRRLGSVQTYRGPPPLWSAPPATYTPPPKGGPSTLQMLLEDADFAYDAVDNPIQITDWRTSSEWPAGAQPVTRRMQYDDLYRLTRVDFTYPTGTDAWVSPFDAEDRRINASGVRRTPSPHVRFDTRPSWQTFAYDWLGNVSASGDDARGFGDRSLGTQTSGTPTLGPHQLRAASNASSTPGSPSREGSLTAAYDAAGNLTSVSMRRDGPCLPAAAICSQRFAYEWDEVGRLSRARRWDVAAPGAASDPLPAGASAAELRYVYDGNDDRAIKASTDAAGTRYALYALDALELRGAGWSASSGDYERSHATEVAYLFAHGVRLARVAFGEEDYPSLTSGASHVLLELKDHLGSGAIVIDRDTSELVERSTYQPYGQAESDYRPERWRSFREDYRFTGKEDDIEVGIQYFGKRYFAPALLRWTSADPLAVHHPGQGDLNLYAYVHGAVLRSIDPLGLDGAVLGSADNPVATSEVPLAKDGSTVNVAAGTIFTYAKGHGVTTFASADAARAAGAKVFYRYDPNASSSLSHATDVADLAKAMAVVSPGTAAGPPTAGDLMQRIVHPFGEGSASGKSGGVFGGMNDDADGNEAVQAMDGASQVYAAVNALRAVVSVVRAGAQVIAARIAGDRALKEFLTNEATQGEREIVNDILGVPRVKSALKDDAVKSQVLEGKTYGEKVGRPIVREFPAVGKGHGWPDIVDNYAGDATQFDLGNGAVLHQLEGDLNGVSGRFEWIKQNGVITHRQFVHGGTINGTPIKP